MEKNVRQITNYCIKNLPELSAVVVDEYYAHLPLCVIDSVFSIGVRYEGVKNSIERFCSHYGIRIQANSVGIVPTKRSQLSSSGFISMMGNSNADYLAENVYRNRQRTSVKNGILKAEAVNKFLNVLIDFGVEYYQDVPKIINNTSFELCIAQIPGQSSGISLKYFFMLTGDETLIKPDRMILRFLADATGNKYSLKQSQDLLSATAIELNGQGYKVTPRRLDNLIWNYQRNK